MIFGKERKKKVKDVLEEEERSIRVNGRIKEKHVTVDEFPDFSNNAKVGQESGCENEIRR